MARKRKIETDTQIYKLPQYGAVVTIEYDRSNPPPFFQPGPGVVIVGEHAYSPDASSAREALGQTVRSVERGGNLIDIDDPRYQDLRRGLTTAPAEREIRPAVLTSEDVFRQVTGGEVNLPPGGLAGLVNAAAMQQPVSFDEDA